MARPTSRTPSAGVPSSNRSSQYASSSGTAATAGSHRAPTTYAAPSSRQHARAAPAAPVPQRRNDREGHGDDQAAKDDPEEVGGWKLGRTIGKGSSGRVKVARHMRTGQYAAVKIVPKHALTASRMSLADAGAKADKALLGIEREIVIMKLIEHPNVMRLYDVWETKNYLYLILEYVQGGELFDYLVAKGRLGADEALRFFQQIIAGVDYCHHFNICHRDLKPENLLLDENRNIKIADFGMAALERNDKLLETSCGSPHYASPEIVSGLNYHGSSSDIWSCGIILFALLTGRLPFDDDNIRTLLSKVKVGKFDMPSDIPAAARDLIRRMLEVNPAQRITMEEIQVHPWFTRLPPKELPYYSKPPTPDQIQRPVTQVDEIDSDILANLRTLWHGSSEDEIVDALISKEKTWEKVFYCLLDNYRNRRVDRFDSNEERSGGARRKTSKRKPVAPAPVALPRSERSKQSLADIASAAAEPQPQRVKVAHSTRPTPQVTRPAPQIPITADRRSASPAIVEPGSPHARGPLPQTPSPQSDGRRSPALFASTTGKAAAAPAIPSIHVQGPTPRSSERYADSNLLAPQSPGQASPTPSVGSSAGPYSPVIPITIPQVDSPAMQQFFHDVVDQLQAMALRSSSPNPGSPSNIDYRQGYSPSSDTRMDPDASRFADAEEMYAPETAYDAQLPVQQQLQQIISRQQKVPQMVNTQPLSIRKPGSGPSSPLQSRRVSPQQHSTPARPPIMRPISAYTQSQTPRAVVPHRREVSSAGHTSDKENHRSGHSVPFHKDMKTAGLGIAGMAPQHDVAPEFEQNNKLLKRRSKTSSPSPLFGSSTSSNDSTSSKGSWFSNLFSWKTAANYVLYSSADVEATRVQCKKMLEIIGASVVIEKADAAGVLRCRIEDIREANGTITAVRACKFRVEFSLSVTGSPASPSLADSRGQLYTCVTLIMEKGTQSSFKAACNRLRAEWHLDTPRSSASPRFRQASDGSNKSAGERYGLGLDMFRVMPTPSPQLENRGYF